MVLETLLLVFSFIIFILLGVVAFHLGSLAFMRARWVPDASWAGSAILVVLIAGGAFGLWKIMGSFFELGTMAKLLQPSVKTSAILLYLAGCLVYIELRSLLSRGYSLRILLDLLDSGGSASVEKLKLGYGGGAGIRGLLVKRLNTLVRLRLLSVRNLQVGPLTLLGKVCAMGGVFMRQLLRLKQVG